MPGYFVAAIQELKILGNTIEFNVEVTDTMMHQDVVLPTFKKPNNALWTNQLNDTLRTYKGIINDNIIVLKTKDFDSRKYVKMK